MIKIQKNWLDITLTKMLYDKFLTKTPHFFGHLSTATTPPFYSFEFKNDDLVGYLINKIKNDFFKDINIQFLRTYINIQHQGMDGGFHEDDGDITGLYFPGPTNLNGGFFEYKENNEIKKISYEENQLILFDAKWPHRGVAFTNYKPRITLAFKIKLI